MKFGTERTMATVPSQVKAVVSKAVVMVTFTVHFARKVATDRTKDAPETVVGLDLVSLPSGDIVKTISASTRFLPGSFFDKIEYDHLSEFTVTESQLNESDHLASVKSRQSQHRTIFP